ncbi:hypothetical protein Pyn_09641 [Prunus yedoensis var. nudiflora]|uniref:Uncharacterized protein n=1 Tax=Prunus yedoensis var. nudiflora TaxID=2094558 RepID=A0A314YTN3_PRUYE|nr:hypothetical protein Pyn_09641 [Prunus yedoensis var. nudiflora]
MADYNRHRWNIDAMNSDAMIDLRFGALLANVWNRTVFAEVWNNRRRLEAHHQTQEFEQTDGGDSNRRRLEAHHQTQEFEQTDGGDSDSNDLRLYQQLYRYATQGKIHKFRDILVKAIDAEDLNGGHVQLLSRKSPQKNTLLHVAVSFGHAKLAILIIQLHNPLLFEKNFEGDTALHIAAKAGDLDTANTLLDETRHSRVRSIVLFLYQGVSTETADVENNDDVLKLLGMKNDGGNTALQEALIHGHQSVAKCLIEADDLPFHYMLTRKESPLCIWQLRKALLRS